VLNKRKCFPILTRCSGYTHVGINVTYQAVAGRYSYIFDPSYFVDWNYIVDYQQQQINGNNVSVLTTCVSPIRSSIVGISPDGYIFWAACQYIGDSFCEDILKRGVTASDPLCLQRWNQSIEGALRWNPANIAIPQQAVNMANDFYNFTMRQNIIVDWTDPTVDYYNAKIIFIAVSVSLNGFLIVFFVVTRVIFWRKLC
jgi:hypothetical protein